MNRPLLTYRPSELLQQPAHVRKRELGQGTLRGAAPERPQGKPQLIGAVEPLDVPSTFQRAQEPETGTLHHLEPLADLLQAQRPPCVLEKLQDIKSTVNDFNNIAIEIPGCRGGGHVSPNEL